MLLLQTLLQATLLVGVAFGSCQKPPTSCKSIVKQALISSSCSKIFKAHACTLKLSTCTSTSTKATPTTTTYVKKGKTTVTYTKTSTTGRATKTVSTACETAVLPKTKTVAVQKTVWETCTNISTIRAISTSVTTKTKTTTKTTTITVTSPSGGAQFKRAKYIIPASCSCFATKTHIVTKTPAKKTKTVSIHTSTVKKTTIKKTRATVTKTIAVAKVTKWTTHTAKKTTTHYKTTRKTVKVTSTSVVHSTAYKTKTIWSTKYVTASHATTTITRAGTANFQTTIFPTARTGIVTVIYYITRSHTTIVLVASGQSAFATTITPASDAPVTVPIQIITYATRPFVTITLPATGDVASATTIIPSDSTNPSIPATVISYAVRSTTTLTSVAFGSVPSATTIYPASSDAGSPVQVVTFVTLPITTVTSLGAVEFTTTVWPTDVNGHTLVDGTRTVIDFVTRSFTTITLPATGTIPYVTTIPPSDPSNPTAPATVITYAARSVVTITSPANGNIPSATTIYPASSDVNLGNPVQVITYVTRPFTTITLPATGSASATTIFPTNPAQPATVITYIPRPTVSVTQRATGNSPSTTTIFPTDPTGAVSVIYFVTEGTVTQTRPTTGSPSRTTIFPSRVGDLVTVIDFEPEVFVTVTSYSNNPTTVTLFPTNSAGQTVSEFVGTITVVLYTPRPVTSIVAVATGASAYATTITPADPQAPLTVINYIVAPATTLTLADSSTHVTTIRPTDSTNPSATVTIITYLTLPVTTVTRVASSSYTTTVYPTDPSDPSGTISVIDFKPQAVTTILRATNSQFTTTLYPTNNVGSTITDDSGTITVVDYVTLAVTSITKTGTASSVTTVFPTDPSDPSGTITVILFEPQVTVTTTLVGTSVYTSTQYPTDSAGSTITDGTGTITVIDYILPPVTTTTVLGSSAYTSTKYPTNSAGSTIFDGTGTITVVIGITQPQTLITRVASTTGLTTIFPTDSLGSTITGDTGTKTIVTFIIQPITTVTVPATSPYTSTAFPTDSVGSTITDGSGIETVIVGVLRSTTTITRLATGTELSTTTITPAGTFLGDLITVIDFVPQSRVTVITVTSSAFTTTAYPTNSAGSTITDINVPITVLIGVTQPATLITRTASVTGLTTQLPTGPNGSILTDGSGTLTIVTFVVESTTTISRVAQTSYTSTLFPTDSIGNTLIDGSEPVTVIIGVPRSITTVTTVGNSAFTSTISPTSGPALTDPTVPITVVVGVSQPYTTLTRFGSSSSTTTVYPTDNQGATITDGSGTITVIDINPRVTTTITRVGTSQYATTIVPTDSASSVVSVIDYITQPYLTITRVGISPTTSTIFPTDSAGSTITDGSDTITIIDIVTLPITTETLVATSAFTTTLYPTDGAGSTIVDGSEKITVIDYIVPPVVTVSRAADGTLSSTTTVYPNPTDVGGTATVIDYIPLPRTTITALASGADGPSTSTFSPQPLDLSGTVTVVNYQVPTMTPSSCNNTGVEVAIFANPFVSGGTLDAASYDCEYFKDKAPYGNKTTQVIGIAAPGTNPQGFTAQTEYRWVMMYRGYFFAPKNSYYTFNVTEIKDLVYFWTGSKAIDGYTKANVDGSGIAAQGGTNFTAQIYIAAQTYLPIRFQHADGGTSGSFQLSVQDSDGVSYAQSLTPSDNFVVNGCSAADNAPIFPAWASELSLPDTSCSNAGLDVAMYPDPFSDSTIENTSFLPEYFKTQIPIGSTMTSRVGFNWASSDPLSPYGLTPDIALNITLNYRGYFYAPRTDQYTFQVYRCDNWCGIWIGQKAYTNYTRANVDAQGWCCDAASGPWSHNTSAVTFSLTAGTYYPFRAFVASWAGPISLNLRVSDSRQNQYVITGVDSPYLVNGACNQEAAPDYPPFGEEGIFNPTPAVPDTSCGNLGMEVAIYNDPFTGDNTANYASFSPEYFKTLPPYNNGTTDRVGVAWPADGQDPYHLGARNLSYTVNHRGYFYAPLTQTYTFTISQADNFAGFWTGNTAKSGWTRANANGISTWNPLAGVSSTGQANIYIVGGTYFPLRMVLGNWAGPGSFKIQITGEQNPYASGPAGSNIYVQYGSPSPYLVRFSCDGTAPRYQDPFGDEDQGNTGPLSPPVTSYTTITIGATSTGVKTYYATDSAGSTITDGFVAGTVVDFKIPPSPTATSVGSAFGCDPYGYISNGTGLYRIDPPANNSTLVKANFDGATNHVRAMGYNALDNYIYGVEQGTGWILRIASDATVTKVIQIANISTYVAGDIDSHGRFWVANQATSAVESQSWAEIDLNPFSNTFGRTLNHGTSASSYNTHGDWVHVPAAGDYLWALSVNSNGKLLLVRWGMVSHSYTTAASYSLTGAGFSSQFGAANGDLYAIQDTGEIYRVNVFHPLTPPEIISNGTSISNANGARCVYGSFNGYH
ncbi:hypothetical protein AA313_de0209499 [Arthrobotrys entomopaga]|nr:hypothetical protein AA313_de0209499 [Arthrobotrys entomopaga]